MERPFSFIQNSLAEVVALRVSSFSYQSRKPRPVGAVEVDARSLPDPARVPELRGTNGRHELQQQWLMQQPGVQRFVQSVAANLLDQDADSVIVGCDNGRDRSVALAALLAQEFGVHAYHAHLNTKLKQSGSRAGYGTRHMNVRRKLLHLMQDGEPCWWCGLPMYRDKSRNWDSLGLAADHREAGGANAGMDADRLLHFKCNSQRQSGKRDAQRPAVLGKHPAHTMKSKKVNSGKGLFSW